MNKGLKEWEREREQERECGDLGENIPAGTAGAQAHRLSVPGG